MQVSSPKCTDAQIGLPIWRMITDFQVRKDAPAVHKELEERGVYSK
jgi:hypothetical protein